MLTNKKIQGAVSVFLVIILVPCIVMTSLFVELGRVHMSQSMAKSASDLALNSLLTNYDADLNEYYGMIASCQNISEYYESTAQLFLRNMSSRKMSEDEIYLIADYYKNVINDEKISDLLQVECLKAPSEMVSSVENANLANAALLKDQVVEFMKFRGPIELTVGFINKFMNSDGSESESISQLKESDKNEQLVEDKKAYYQAEGDLLKAAFNTFDAIRTYGKKAKDEGINNEKMQEYADKINSYKGVYSDIHRLTVTNLFNTAGLGQYNRVTYSLDAHNEEYTEEHSEVYSNKEEADGETHYYIDNDRIDSLLDDLEDKIEEFETAKDDYASAASSLLNNMYGEGDGQANAIQWWVRMNEAVNDSSDSKHNAVSESANNMLIAYSKVLAITKCELSDEAYKSTWESRYNSLTEKVREYQSKYLVSGNTDNSDPYLRAVNALEQVSSAFQSKIQPSGVFVSVGGQSRSVENAISFAASDLLELRNLLQARVDELNKAIDGDESADVKSLDQLKELAGTYKTNLGNWTNTAQAGDTSMKKEDRARINRNEGIPEEEQVSEEEFIDQYATKITEEAVIELKNRLVNIRSQFQTLIDAIDSIKYGEMKVIEIKDFNTFKSRAGSKVDSSDIPLNNGELRTYADNTFSQLFLPSSEKAVTLTFMPNNGNNPDIDPKEGNSVNTPELLKYFYQQWKDIDKGKVDTAKQDEEDAKSRQKDYEIEKKETARKYRGAGQNITKEISSGNSFDLGTGIIGSLVGLIKNIIDGNFGAIRDDIYVTTYFRGMFSFATFDREGMYSLLSDEEKKELDLDNFTDYYDNVEGSAEEEKTWLSENLKDSYNKSLTNKMINQTNNAAYLAELEYILYGKETNQDNLNDAFGQIYFIRFALNTISAFQNYWSDEKIEAVAAAVSGISGGVIPPQVIKAIMLPIMAAIESCTDINRLSAGFPVEIYKKKEDWWLLGKLSGGSLVEFVGSLTSDFKEGEDNLKPKNKDEGIFYSDYITIFLYLGLSGGGNLEEDMYKRMAEVIQTNLRKQNGDDSYSLSKALVYFQLDASIKVKPLMIRLPFFNSPEYENDLETNTDWCTYPLQTIRGYK